MRLHSKAAIGAGCAAMLAGFAGFVTASPAHAAADSGKVSVSGTTVALTATAGIANSVSVGGNGSGVITIESLTAGHDFTVGAGCRRPHTGYVICGSSTARVNTIKLDLGDNSDEVQLQGAFRGEVIGRGGNDTVRYIHGFGTLAGSSSVRFSGGLGSDTASYGSSDKKISIIQDDQANDGRVGDTDDIRSDVERIIGSDFDDYISATDDANDIRPLRGSDKVFGNGGADTIDSSLDFNGESDRIDCGNDTDSLIANVADERFNCELVSTVG